jgi:predicted RNA binding protein YcfA (HicA-like mRNA interferase family)
LIAFYTHPQKEGAVVMKHSEFIQWLVQQGVEFQRSRGGHLTAKINDKQTKIPGPPGSPDSKEIGEGLRRAIIKNLGL